MARGTTLEYNRGFFKVRGIREKPRYPPRGPARHLPQIDTPSVKHQLVVVLRPASELNLEHFTVDDPCYRLAIPTINV